MVGTWEMDINEIENVLMYDILRFLYYLWQIILTIDVDAFPHDLRFRVTFSNII